MIQSIELRHSPWINDIDKPNILENNTYRSFNLMFNTNIDRVSMLIHFKALKIHEMQLYYRKNGTKSNKATKVYPQHKMRLSFNNTLELLTYLSNKNYNVDWFNIKFENGWHIKDHLINGLECITNSTIQRNMLIEKLITISGQGTVDIDKLEVNQTYTFHTDASVKLQPLLF